MFGLDTQSLLIGILVGWLVVPFVLALLNSKRKASVTAAA